MLLAYVIARALTAHATDYPESGLALRVRVNERIVLGEEDLQRMKFPNEASAQATFRRNVIQLKQGQSVQLKVEMVDMRGTVTDVTKSGAVEYQSASPWKLSVSPEGLVTMAPAERDQAPKLWASSVGDTAVYISLRRHPSGAWNKIFFSAGQ